MKFLFKSDDARSKIKMINNSGDRDFLAKQESDNNDSKIPKTTYGSRQWASFKNPRIVRVSRSFGGKDRHSKVCTVRGLRDRRIRLSVPTAIQLYDLQDRLGLSQPSKVVDWLIDNTKDDIDKLPPLQMPPGGDFSLFRQANTLIPHHDLNSSQSSLISPFFNSNTSFLKDQTKELCIKINDHGRDENDQRMKGKEIENESAGLNFFPLANPSSLPNFSFSPYYNWEPSSLSLSQFGNQGFSSQQDSSQGTSHHPLSLLPSSLALPSASQFFFCPQTATTPPLFPQLPPYMTGLGEAHDPRQVNNHFQLLSSGSQQVLSNPPVPFLHSLSDSQDKSTDPSNMNSKKHSQNNEDRKGKRVSLAQNFLS